MDRPEWERRIEQRVRVRRPCKVFEPFTGKYWPGTTADLTSGGALVYLDRPLEVTCGTRLFVGIALKRRQSVIRASEMIDAEVLRTMLTVDDKTMLALRFVEPAAVGDPAVAAAA